MTFSFKYGKGQITLSLPEDKLAEVIGPSLDPPAKEPESVVKNSLKQPVGSPKLAVLFRNLKSHPSVTITVEDHTRPVPSEIILAPLMEKLNSLGVREENVTILITTGLHRDLNSNEMNNLRDVVGKGPRLVNHHAENPSELYKLGQLNYQNNQKELYVNQKLSSADVSIVTGDVGFHYLFGYGGGAKSILPGASDADSIRFNHSLMDLEEARAGNLDNPLRCASERAAKLLNIDFSINLVLNPDKELLYCYSGDIIQAHRKAVRKVDEIYKVPFNDIAELVIVEAGGYPKDLNLYQAQKAVENGLKLVKAGGDLVLVAQCPEGWGSNTFRKWVNEVDDLSEVIEKIKENFVIGGHKAYIYAQEKQKANLFLLSDIQDGPDLRKIFTPVSPGRIQRMAEAANSVSVLKMGSSTLPVKKRAT